MKGCEKRGRLDVGAFMSVVESMNPGALAAAMPKGRVGPVKSAVQQDIVDAALAKRKRKAERFRKILPEA